MMDMNTGAVRDKKVRPVTNLSRPEWGQQPNEPPRSFSFFQLYRDLGGERSIAEVARQAEHSYDSMADIAKRWRWKDRAEAYTRHLDAIAMAEFEEGTRTMARRQAKLGRLLQEKAEGALGQLVYDDENMPSAKDVATLADVGVKIERLARGENTGQAETIQIVMPSVPDWAKGSPLIAQGGKKAIGEVGPEDGTEDLLDGESVEPSAELPPPSDVSEG